MHKKILIPVVLVIIAAAALIGIKIYENKIVDTITAKMADMPRGWQASARDVSYSFWGGRLTLNDFTLSLTTDDGVYASHTEKMEAEGLSLSAFLSSDIATLAKRAIFTNLSGSMPNGSKISVELEDIKGLSGPFGRIRELSESGAPSRELLKAIYQIKVDELKAVNLTMSNMPAFHSPQFPTPNMDGMLIKEMSGSNISALKADNIVFIDSIMRAGQHDFAVIDLMEARYDLSSLQDIYVMGQGRQLLSQAFHPDRKLNVYYLIKQMHCNAYQQTPAFDIESLSFAYVSDDTLKLGLTLDRLSYDLESVDAMAAKSLKEALDGKGLTLSGRVESLIREDEFSPTVINVELQDLAVLGMTLNLQGKSPQSFRFKYLEGKLTDTGLLEVMLKVRGGNTAEGVETARQQMLVQVAQKLTGVNNPILTALGGALEQFINNPGTLTFKAAPDQPLNLQQAAMAFMFNPAVFNVRIEAGR